MMCASCLSYWTDEYVFYLFKPEGVTWEIAEKMHNKYKNELIGIMRDALLHVKEVLESIPDEVEMNLEKKFDIDLIVKALNATKN